MAPPRAGDQPLIDIFLGHEGAGVVLGRISLTQRALKSGRLVAPYPLSITTPAHYRFVCPEGGETRPQVAAFLDWLRDQTAEAASHEKGRQFVAAEDIPKM